MSDESIKPEPCDCGSIDCGGQKCADSLQQVVLHGEGQQEHSLCGMAFDAYDSGDADEPIIFAKSGEVVTCPECRAELDFVRRCYRRYRYEPKVQNVPMSGTPKNL